MRIILRNEEQWENLPNRVYTLKPDSYPCLAVGTWQSDTYGPEGYEYEFVYLIDESPDDINQEEKFSLDLSKL